MLSEVHKKILVDSAIDPDLATICGIHSVTNPEQLPDNLRSYGTLGLGIAFPWCDYLTGDTTYQVRLDEELEGGRKYIWPKGVTQKLAIITDAGTISPVMLVEGYKQAMAIYSTLGTDTDYTILAMAGCYGTSNIDTSGLEDREVYVVLDADVRKKQGVWEAADGIGHQLKSVGCTVRYITAPGTGSQGIDDCLATRKTVQWRKKMLDRLILEASVELPTKPNVTPISAAKSAPKVLPNGVDADLFDPISQKFLLTAAAAKFLNVTAQFDGPNGPVRSYTNGVYSAFDEDQLGVKLSMMCGDMYKTSYISPTWDRLRGELQAFGNYPNEFMDKPLLNTPSGMVHLVTGEFYQHDPRFFSTVQIGTDYDPEATCPTFDAWIADMAGDQSEALLEYFAQLLDPTRAPAKHIILEGPPGSGKSTMIRIIQSVISGHYSGLSPFTSSLTMHQLNEGGFHTSQLAGKLFNSAGELKADEINDITEFKMLTGDDAVTANVKNKQHVTFRPRALFCFAMNEFPKVRDAEPYFRRVTPFRFENQKGKDNPDQTIEDTIRHHELSGVLNRLIQARQRTTSRGYLPGANQDVIMRFQGETNPILAWYWSEDNPFAPGWYPASEVYNSYRASMVEQGIDYETQIMFSRRMDGVDGFLKERRRINGKVTRAVYMPKREGMSVTEISSATDDDDTDPPSSPPPAPEPDPSPLPPTPTVHQEYDRVEVTPKSGPVVTFDMETDGLNQFWSSTPGMYPRLIGWQVEDEEVQTCTPEDSEKFFADLYSAGVIVGQNVIDFDLLALHRSGDFDLDDVIEGRQLVLDTMIVARQLTPPGARQSKAARPYSLRNLAEKHEIPINKDILKQLAKEFDTSGVSVSDPAFSGFGEIPVDHPEYVEYLKDDVRVTRQVLKAEVGENLGRLTATDSQPRPESMVGYLRREHRVAAIAAKTRYHGVRVDRALLEERVSTLDQRRAARLSTLRSEYGLPEEGKAPQASDAGKAAIRAALLDLGMGKDEQPLTEKGAYSFSGESMQTIIDRNPGNQELKELCEVVAELNGMRTVYHTTLDNLREDGRVHPQIDFRQATGRWSVTDPGMTVMGKRGVNANEREIFLPDEGHVFINADFAQVDARCVAAHSQDPAYLELFQGDRDLHTEVAIAVFHDGSPEKRQIAKVIGHGWNYGGSPAALAASSGAALADVEAFDRAARATFLKVVDWQNEVRARAMRGELLNNGFGRRLRCEPDRARTQAPALVGQSCARDIAMEALLRMDPVVRDSLRMFIHDEFVFSVPEDQVDVYRAEIERAMRFEWMGVPFFGDAGKPASNWMRCYDK